MKKPFQHVYNEDGTYNEMDTMEAFEEYVGDVSRARRLQYLFNNSYPHSDGYFARTEIFRTKAKREGFADQDVNAYLSLP